MNISLDAALPTDISQNAFTENERPAITLTRNESSTNASAPESFTISLPDFVKSVSTLTSQIASTSYSQHYVFSQTSGSNITLDESVQDAIRDAAAGKIGRLTSSLSMRQASSSSSKTKSKEDNSLKMRLLSMQDIKVAYSLEDVPIPNIPSFARNVSQLFDEWDKSDILVIRGVPIPLRYWSEIYRQKPVTWKVLKKPYSDWKVRF